MGHTESELRHTELVRLYGYVKVAFLFHVHQAGLNWVVNPAVDLRPKPLHCMVLENEDPIVNAFI